MRTRVADIPIYYEARGQGRTFILFHGSPGDHRDPLNQVDPAFRGRRGWRRVYPDLPGHGRTPGSPRIQDLDDYLRVLLDFVDVISGHEAFCVGGISFGAYLALGVARKRRRRIAGLLLSVPEIHHSPIEDRSERRHGISSARAPWNAAEDPRDYVEDTPWLQGLPFRDVAFDLYRGHPRLRAPALFLFGGQDASFRSRRYWRMLPDFPEATFAVLASAGHRLWVDRPDAARALTRDWLDRLENPRGGD